MKKKTFSQFDCKLYCSSYALILLAFIFYMLGNFFIAENWVGLTVILIEHAQSLFLLFMAGYTYSYAQKVKSNPDVYKFWIWTIFWWLLLFGRGISWGRDFFPEVPRFYYKIIASILIAIPILSMFIVASIRREIKRRYSTEKIPVWHTFFAFFYLGLADIAEHHRIGYEYLVLNSNNSDLIEELMEFPCLFSLALVVFYLQKREKISK